MDEAVGHEQQDGNSQVFFVPRIPETGAVGDQKNAYQPDEPATPDGNPRGKQDHVRVGQGARRHPPPNGSNAGLQQVPAPGLESCTWMRFAIPDRIPHPKPGNLSGANSGNAHQMRNDYENTMY